MICYHGYVSGKEFVILKHALITATAAITMLMMVFTLTPVPQRAVFGASVGAAETPSRYDDDYTEHNCLDISSWNGDLDDDDWKAMKDAGVDSVIIRAGYSKLNTGRMKEDERFKQNLKNATKHGMKAGVYYFTCALSKSEAKKEAEFFLDIIEPYKEMISLPVALDFETNSGGRLNAYSIRDMGTEKCTAICTVFCDMIADAGYEPMLYASRGLLDSYLDSDELEGKYLIWLAQYTSDLSATGYEGEYYIWQYSENVHIDGIRCRFDGNYLYEKDITAMQQPKDIETSSNHETVTYRLSDDVKSVVPADSSDEISRARVTDKSGFMHKYTIYNAESLGYSSDDCLLACLISGYFYASNGVNPEYVHGRVIPAVFGKDFSHSENLTMDHINRLLSKLKLETEYHDSADSDVLVNIKGNLAKGNPVIISIKADNSKWSHKSQKLLLIGMDEDGRAILADTVDREWFESDQRVKLTDVDELTEYIDNGYILVK